MIKVHIDIFNILSMPQVHNGETYYTLEEAQAIIHAQIEKDAIEVAHTICERRRLKSTE